MTEVSSSDPTQIESVLWLALEHGAGKATVLKAVEEILEDYRDE